MNLNLVVAWCGLVVQRLQLWIIDKWTLPGQLAGKQSLTKPALQQQSSQLFLDCKDMK